ncbi:hypothetical protein SIC45_16420 [Marinococcus sp. PL1-022]|nr:hypothetical protein [Marinococcus sp. PL1-022]MDX6154531.1 hypothetical protein [Marinococcus sp. PL1-022]
MGHDQDTVGNFDFDNIPSLYERFDIKAVASARHTCDNAFFVRFFLKGIRYVLAVLIALEDRAAGLARTAGT